MHRCGRRIDASRAGRDMPRIMGKKVSAVVIGAGHNGLVAAVMLAEARPVGARARGQAGDRRRRAAPSGRSRRRRSWRRRRAPTCSASCRRSSCRRPASSIPVMRRDPHYFLPTTDDALSALRLGPGGDEAAVHRASSREADWRANAGDERRARRSSATTSAPTWLEEPLSIEETAERYVRAPLRQIVRRSLPQAGRRLPRSLRLQERSGARDVRRDRRLLRPLRRVGHAGHRHELPRPQHVSPARHATARG